MYYSDFQTVTKNKDKGVMIMYINNENFSPDALWIIDLNSKYAVINNDGFIIHTEKNLDDMYKFIKSDFADIFAAIYGFFTSFL